eukprot:3952776-Lingulodinium_polyedra.AAC.1
MDAAWRSWWPTRPPWTTLRAWRPGGTASTARWPPALMLRRRSPGSWTPTPGWAHGHPLPWGGTAHRRSALAESA